MNAGFIYVLANSSMPNLVKVGLTTKDPAGRAKELSGATGVPTPFMVIYQLQVCDCSAAEAFVHTMLGKKGYRVSENREFFNAPVMEVMSAVNAIPSNLRMNGSVAGGVTDLVDDEVEDELSDLVLDDSPSVSSQPWADLWQEAENAYYGFGDSLKDYDEAFRLYNQAAKLGCSLAFYRIGYMYKEGEGVPESASAAVRVMKQGARDGNYACYLGLAVFFFKEKQIDNAVKCLKFFMRDRQDMRSVLIESELSVMHSLALLMATNHEGYFEHANLQQNGLDGLRVLKSELLETLDKGIESTVKNNLHNIRDLYVKAKQLVSAF